MNKRYYGWFAPAVLIAALATAGCSSSGPTTDSTTGGTTTTGGGTIATATTAPAPAQAEATLVYVAGCQVYRAAGRADVPGAFCVKRYSTNPPQWIFASSAAPSKPIFLQDYSASSAGYDLRFWYGAQLWSRSPVNNPDALEVCYRSNVNLACQWVTPDGYKLAVAQQAQIDRLNQQAAAQAAQQAQSNAQATVAANQAQFNAALAQVDAAQARSNAAFLRPACDSSYTGC